MKRDKRLRLRLYGNIRPNEKKFIRDTQYSKAPEAMSKIDNLFKFLS